ncbi:MAG: CDP-alcohol phosphatidyltransferase family protein [Candidatus Binatia bacterium]
MTTRFTPLAAHAVSLLRPVLGVGVLAAIPSRLDSVLLLPIVLLACASDWVDGEVARRTGTQTQAGRLVDNVCDFAFLLCLFSFLALSEVWSPPVWGRLVRHVEVANWLPVYALLASFGVYFVRLCVDLRAGREPARSMRGHAAGVCNFLLVVVGATELTPGIDLGPWLLEPAMVTVALLNVLSVPENLRLMFLRDTGTPRMPA